MPTDQLHHYDELFYRYQREGSLRSARNVLPHLKRTVPYASVLDVGCGAGAWLAAHGEQGVSDIVGIDGDYVDRSVLLFDRQRFRPQNIIQRFDLGRRFDLVQCLEVAEHVPTEASASLVENLVRHGSSVLFSAAVPGQGGEDHINEQHYEFWRDLFAVHGYRLFDFLRPLVSGNMVVEPWYRYNLLFFVHDSEIAGLSAGIKASRVPDEQAIRDWSPLGYRIRKLLLRQLPPAAVTRLSIWNYRRAVSALRAS